jgi:hypothetical protein
MVIKNIMLNDKLIMTICRNSDKVGDFLDELNTSNNYDRKALIDFLRSIVIKHGNSMKMCKEEFEDKKDFIREEERSILTAIFSNDHQQLKEQLVFDCEIWKEDMIDETFASWRELGDYLTHFCFNKQVLLNSQSTTYIRTKHCWIEDNGKDVESIVQAFIKNQDFKIKNGDKVINIDTPNAWKNAYNTMKLETKQDQDFKDKMFRYEKGKIFFEDGCWDFVKKCFVKGDNNTRIYMKRKFQPKSDPKIREEIYRRILKPFFTIREEDHPENDQRTEVMKFYMNRLSRSLSGLGSNKNPNVVIGDRDGGKSLLVKIKEMAFCAYQGSFDLEILRKDNNPDTGRTNAKWCDYETKRIAVSLESPEKSLVIDGSKIKKLCSNGDKIQFRKLHHESSSGRIFPNIWSYVNDMPKISGDDAREKIMEYKVNTRYYKEDEIPEEKRYNTTYWVKQDDTIEDFITQEVADEFLLMVIEAHDEIISIPQTIKEEKINEEIDINDVIKELFVKGDENSFVSYEVIKPLLNNEISHGSKILKRFREVFGKQLTGERKGRLTGIYGIEVKTDDVNF